MNHTKNVQSYDIKECVICLAVVEAADKHVQCRTCESKYHFDCAVKWYSKSSSKICPTCQQNDLLVYTTRQHGIFHCIQHMFCMSRLHDTYEF